MKSEHRQDLLFSFAVVIRVVTQRLSGEALRDVSMGKIIKNARKSALAAQCGAKS